MSGSSFYDLGALDQIAVNLFYGWGYNFYRLENQLRSDDLLIREKACWLLGQSRALIESAQSLYRREHLPPPTRTKPLPSAEAVAAARLLEDLSARVGQVEATIRSLPVPETDRMTQRCRQETETLRLLGSCDRRLVGYAEMLRRMLTGKDPDWILANTGEILGALDFILQRVQERQELLK